MKRVFRNLFVLLLFAGCDLTPDTRSGAGEAGSAADAGATGMGSSTQFREDCQAALNVCPQSAYSICDDGNWLSDIGCTNKFLELYQCISKNSAKSFVCDERGPCFVQYLTVNDCLRSFCITQPTDSGCVAVFGCQGSCSGKTCGQDDGCGIMCTSCPIGKTCNTSTKACETNTSGGGGGTVSCSTNGPVEKPVGKTCTGTGCKNFSLNNGDYCGKECSSSECPTGTACRSSTPNSWCATKCNSNADCAASALKTCALGFVTSNSQQGVCAY